MSGFIEQLMLAEKAAENIYFARVDRELIEMLHHRMLAGEVIVSNRRSSAEDRTPDSPVAVKETGVG